MHKQSPYILVLSVAGLITIGLVMLYGTGAFAPDSHGDQFSFLKKQGFWLGVGFISSIVFALLDYHWLERCWYLFFGTLTFQPSELAKLAAIIFAAWWFTKFEAKSSGFLMGLVLPIAVVSTLLLLIVFETDLGTT